MNRKPKVYKTSALTIAPIPYRSPEQDSNLRVSVLQTDVLATSPSGQMRKRKDSNFRLPEGEYLLSREAV